MIDNPLETVLKAHLEDVDLFVKSDKKEKRQKGVNYHWGKELKPYSE